MPHGLMCCLHTVFRYTLHTCAYIGGTEMTQQYPAPAYGRRVLFLAFGSTSSMVLGVSSIMPMVPVLARVFDVSQTTASLVITAFTLPGILFALLAGILADRFGRRAILASGLFLFVVAGTACAFTDNFHTLLALRFLQGVGAAPLGVLNATIIADTWSGRTMSTMIGYNITVLNAFTAIYPSLGGVLAHFDWRYPFFLPLLALPVFIVALTTPLANPGVAGSFRQYLSDVGRIFTNKRICGLLCITGVTFLLLFGPIFICLPVLADSRFDSSSASIGGVMFFSSLGAILTASQLGRLYSRISPRNLLLVSQGLYLVSLLSLPQVPDLAWTLFPILLFGMGQGLNIPNVQAQLLDAASATQRAAVMSVNGMLLRLGQTLAPVSFSYVMVTFGINWGFHLGVMLVCVLTLLVLAFVSSSSRI